MEKICQNCNRPNSSDAAFCRHCATPLGDAPGSAPHQAAPPPPQQNQQWNQPQGGQQQAQFAAQPAGGTSSKGILAVGLAAVGLVLCCGPFTGIPAAILGWLEMTAIKEGRAPANGMWMAQVGLWGGIAVSVLGVISWFFMMLMSMASGPAYYY